MYVCVQTGVLHVCMYTFLENNDIFFVLTEIIGKLLYNVHLEE